MFIDHDIFNQAAKENKKIIVTYFNSRRNLYLTRLCVPIQYTCSDMEENAACYYLWDSEAEVGEHLLALPPSEIAYMELSNEIFDPNDYIIPETH